MCRHTCSSTPTTPPVDCRVVSNDEATLAEERSRFERSRDTTPPSAAWTVMTGSGAGTSALL